MMKIYGIENYDAFAANNGMSTLRESQLNHLKQRENELKGLLSVCNFCPTFMIRKHSPSDIASYRHQPEYYLYSFYVVVFYKGVPLVPAGAAGARRTFAFYLDVETKNDFLSSFCYDELNLNAPQKVGVATFAKMDKWVSYLQSVEQAMSKHIADTQYKIDTFKSELAKYGDVVHYYSDQKNSGEVSFGGLQYRFSISESGHIEQQITTALRISEATIDNFMIMAGNKLKIS